MDDRGGWAGGGDCGGIDSGGDEHSCTGRGSTGERRFGFGSANDSDCGNTGGCGFATDSVAYYGVPDSGCRSKAGDSGSDPIGNQCCGGQLAGTTSGTAYKGCS